MGTCAPGRGLRRPPGALNCPTFPYGRATCYVVAAFRILLIRSCACCRPPSGASQVISLFLFGRRRCSLP